MAPTRTCATNVARTSRCSEVEEAVGHSQQYASTRTVCVNEPSFLGHVSENGSRKQTTTTTNPKQTLRAPPPPRQNHPSKGNGAGSKVFGFEIARANVARLNRPPSSSSSATITTNRDMSDGNKASNHNRLKEEEHSEVENDPSDSDSYHPTNVKVEVDSSVNDALIRRPTTRANEKKVTGTLTKQGSRRSYNKSLIEIIDSSDETSKWSQSSSPPLRKSLRSSKFSGNMNDSKRKADDDDDGDGDDDDLISAIELPDDSKKKHRDCKTSSNSRNISTNTTTYKSDESSLNSQMDQDDESYDEEEESSSVGSSHSWDEKSPSRVSRNGRIKRKAGTRTSSRRRVVYHDSPILSASSSIASNASSKSPPTTSPSRRNGKKSPYKRRKRSAKHPKSESQIQTPTSTRHDSDISSDDNSASGESNTEEEEEVVVGLLPIHRIIASRTETIQTWHKVCQTMNTSEVMNGSRWSQEKKQDCSTEERFLVKWRDLSYLHCTWETESDLLLCENKKLYLGTFRRKNIGGLMFDEEERGDGEFMNPCLVEIDRIVEIDEDDEEEDKKVTSLENKAKEAKASHGMIFDMDDPNYHSGAGRQFLVKWKNTPYSDLSYEFERDLIAYDVEYESHVKSFQERKKKPSKEEVRKARTESEKEKRRLYKIFGDRASSTDEKRDAMVKSYQTEISKRSYPNNGELRDYQVEGVSWLISNYINRRSSILADEMVRIASNPSFFEETTKY
eukprot:scaffold135122_cov54-Attheya_sp.AAC.2